MPSAKSKEPRKKRTGVRTPDAAASRVVRFVSSRKTLAKPYRLVRYDSLAKLGRSTGLSEDDLAGFLGVSTKTLARRAEQGRLDEVESLKTEMLAYVLNEAARVFGDDATARRWLTSPVASLDGLRPLDHLDSIEGYERVRETLAKIEYGMY